jgi:hypothetical protein
MPLDDPRLHQGWSVTGEHPPDGGDPIVALRNHFGENAKRLSQQIEQADKELRSLAVQHRAFLAALEALDVQQNPQVITES